MTTVRASAGRLASQIMEYASSWSGRTGCLGGSRLGRRQGVGDAAGVGARGGHHRVRVRESPAAFGPMVLADAADAQCRRIETARRKGLGTGIAVATGGPADLRKWDGVAGGVGERNGEGRRDCGSVGARTGRAVEAADVELGWQVAEEVAVPVTVSGAAVGGHRLRCAVTDCVGGDAHRHLVDRGVDTRRAGRLTVALDRGVVAASEEAVADLEIDHLG